MTAQYGLLTPVWADTDVATATSDEALLYAMLHVEAAWAETLAEAGAVPQHSAAAIRSLCERQADPRTAAVDPAYVAAQGAGGGNPVIPMLSEVRRALAAEGASDAGLHVGATSQDILDSALNLVVRTAAATIAERIRRSCDAAAAHAQEHRDTLCVARSLTQPALPTTFGLRAAGWLDGMREAAEALQEAVRTLPLQWGGAVGTQAALADRLGPAAARDLTDALGRKLRLPVARPWHTQRQPLLDVAAGLGAVTSALGTVAADVLIGQRPEIGELREPSAPGRGGSSAMPQKQNPVLSVLIRSASQAAPAQLATLYQAAANAVDERPDGAWHAEWPALAELLRLAGGAAARADELLTGLHVDPERMRANLEAAGSGVVSERLLAHVSPVYPGGKPALQEAIKTAVTTGRPLREILERGLTAQAPDHPGPEGSPDPTGPPHTDDGSAAREAALASLPDLLDPSAYLGRAGEFVDEAVDSYREIRSTWT